MHTYRAQKLVSNTGEPSATLLGPDGVVEPAEDYLRFLADIGRSWNTVRAYASDLALYFEFLDQTGARWDTVDTKELGAFSAYLRRTNRRDKDSGQNLVVLRAEKTRAPASTQRGLSAVFGFYDFHRHTSLSKTLSASRAVRADARHNASRTRRSPFAITVPKTMKACLTAQELVTVLTTPRRLRDQLLLSLMGLNGLRVGAALGLHHPDVRIRRRELAIQPRLDNANDARAKRTTLLVVPMHDHVRRLYGEYLETEYGNSPSDYVFVNLWAGQLDRPMMYSTARSIVDRTASASGVPFTAHTLRHTFATLLRREGADMELVSEMLGHSSSDVTRETYIHTTVEDLRRSLELVEEAKRRAR